MLTLLAIVIGYLACRAAPRLLAEAVATLIGVAILWSGRRTRRALLASNPDFRTAAEDRQPTRRQRRLLRASFRAAMRGTAYTSIFPDIACRVTASSI